MEKQIITIHKALAAINKQIKAIGKTERNQQQNFMFRGIDAVMNELHDLFAKNEVVIIPEVLDYEVTERQNNKGTILFATRARVKFHFTASDGSEVTATMVGEAMDSGDKGMNKAMSIALKYALLQMFLIPTKEDKDPDSQSHEVVAYTKAQMDAAVKEMRECSNRAEQTDLWQRVKRECPAMCAKGTPFYDACAVKSNELKQTA